MDASVAILDDWSLIRDPRLGTMPDLVRSAWEGSRAGKLGSGNCRCYEAGGRVARR